MLNNLFASTAMKVAAGTIAILVGIIGVLVAQLHAAGALAAKRKEEVAMCELKHLHTRNSLRALEQDLARIEADSAARENRLAEAAREQAKRTEVIQDEVIRIVEQTPSGESFTSTEPPPGSPPSCRTAEHILKSETL